MPQLDPEEIMPTIRFRALITRVALSAFASRALRIFSASCLLVSLVFTVLPVPTAHAASYVVNTLNDNTTDDAFCTLREAINAANNTSGSNTNCGALSGADDTITFSVSGTITLVSQLPSIQSLQGTLTIDGGSTVTISGNNAVLVLSMASANLTLQNVTIANGRTSGNGGAIFNGGTLTITNSTISGNSASGSGIGGGIFNDGTMTITNSTFSGNSANYGGGIYNNTGATVTITNSTFSSNSAPRGGGIYNGGTLTVTSSTFSGNSADYGGGINNGGTLTVSNSTFSNNSATNGGDGGGIYNFGTTTTITNSTFSGNSSTGSGGGISNDSTLTVSNSTFSNNSATSSGGGISNGGTLTVSNSTFSGNSAAGPGGGGINNGGTLTVSNSTFSNNSATSGGGGIRQAAGTVTLKNTIVANSASGGNCSGTITDGGNNLDSANTCGFTTNAKINTDPNLGALTGSPQYFPLNTGSAAIDAGTNTGCPTDSQNGVTRPADGDGNGTATCDIGSYEAPTISVPSSSPVLPSASFNGSTTISGGNAFYLNAFYGHVHVNTYGNHYGGAVKITSNGITVCIEVPAGYEIIGASCYTDKEGGRKDFYIKPKTTQPQTITLPNGFAVGASGGIFNLLPWSFTIPPNVLGNNSSFKLEFFTGAAPNAPDGLRLFFRVLNAQIFDSTGKEVKTFNPPLQLCYTFSDAELQSVGGDAKNFVILTSSDGKTWEELATTVDLANKKICASVNHFSLFEMSSRIPTKIPTTGDASMPWWMWVIGLLGGGVVGWLVMRRRTI